MTEQFIADMQAIYTGAVIGGIGGLLLASPFIVWMYVSDFRMRRIMQDARKRARDSESRAFAAFLDSRPT